MINAIEEIKTISNLCYGIDFTEKTLDLVIKYYDQLSRIQNGLTCPSNFSEERKLALALYNLPAVKQQYEKKGISDFIFYATMYDIKIWADRYFKKSGKLGLENFAWIKHHLSLNLFRIGRLQYQFANLRLPYYIGIKGLIKSDFVRGKCLYLHIPEGEKLIYEACIESLLNATVFFKSHYPDYNYKGITCQSWLLYKNNKLFMNENSNIMKFQNLFNIVANSKNPSQAKERIFENDYDKDNPTTLQKTLLNYDGMCNVLGEGFGFVKKEFLKQ